MDNIHRGYINIRTSFNGFSHDLVSPSIADDLFCKCYIVHKAMRSHDYAPLDVARWFAIIGA